MAHVKGTKSHDIVTQGLEILKNLDHRGAVGADPLQGDGAGILIQIPDALYREEFAARDVKLPAAGEYGVGMVFMPRRSPRGLHARKRSSGRFVPRAGAARLARRAGQPDMPMSPTVKAKEPVIRQVFIGRGPDIMVTDALERRLYVIRRRAANAINALKLKHGTEFYMVSMSARTVNYKGCCWPPGR